MRMLSAYLAMLASFGWLTSASAATINVTKGSISINGRAPVTGTFEVQPGDSIAVGPNGAALITYANGCKMNADAGTVVTVLTDAQCQLAQAPAPQQPTGLSGTTMALGAAAVAGAVGVAVALGGPGGGDNKKPASP